MPPENSHPTLCDDSLLGDSANEDVSEQSLVLRKSAGRRPDKVIHAQSLGQLTAHLRLSQLISSSHSWFNNTHTSTERTQRVRVVCPPSRFPPTVHSSSLTTVPSHRSLRTHTRSPGSRTSPFTNHRTQSQHSHFHTSPYIRTPHFTPQSPHPISTSHSHSSHSQ